MSTNARVDSSSTERPIEGLGGTATSYHVEHAREEVGTGGRHSTAPRKGPGPLGMESQEAGEASARGSETRARQAPAYDVEVQPFRTSERVRAPVSAQRVQVVEINAPPLDLSNTNHRADIVSSYASAAPASAPSQPTSRSVPPDAPAEASASARDLDPLAGASVLDAPPSMHVSDRPKPQGPSWGMLVMVAVMSSIIAAAGMLALQEWRAKRAAEAAPAKPAETTAAASTENAPAVPPPAPVMPAVAPPSVPASPTLQPAVPSSTSDLGQATPALGKTAASPVAARPTARAAAASHLAPAAAPKLAKPEAPVGEAAPAPSEGAAEPATNAAAPAEPSQADEPAGEDLPVNPY